MKKIMMSEEQEKETIDILFEYYNETDFTDEKSVNEFIHNIWEQFYAAVTSFRIYEIIPAIIEKISDPQTLSKPKLIKSILSAIYGEMFRYIPLGIALNASQENEIKEIYNYLEEKEKKGEELDFSDSNLEIEAIGLRKGLYGQKILSNQVNLLYPMLKHSDPEIKLWVMYFISWIRDKASENQKHFLNLLEQEKNEYVKSGIIISLGLTQYYLKERNLLTLFYEYFNSSSILFKIVAAIAIYTAEESKPPEKIESFIVEAIHSPNHILKNYQEIPMLPWIDGNLEYYLELCYLHFSPDIYIKNLHYLLQDLFKSHLEQYIILKRLCTLLFPENYSKSTILNQNQAKFICACILFLPKNWPNLMIRQLFRDIGLIQNQYSEISSLLIIYKLEEMFINFLEELSDNDEEIILKIINDYSWSIISDHNKLNKDDSESYNVPIIIGKWLISKGKELDNQEIEAYGMDLKASALSFSDNKIDLKEAIELFEKAKNINPEWYSPNLNISTKNKLGRL